MRRVIVLMALVIILSGGVLHLSAQSENPLCPAFVERALTQVGNFCGNLPRNTACYGFTQVEATFGETVEEQFFTQPADLSALVQLRTIRTYPLDLENDQWGIAVLNAQANVPNTLPGQAVTFLLIGDTELENAAQPTEGDVVVTVTTIRPADLRNAPAPGAAVIERVRAGEPLEADAVSEDGVYLRLKSDLGVVWIEAAAVEGDTSSLPTAARNQDAPMQAFYFRNSPGQLSCTQTPSVLAVRSPENITVDLTANGANIRVGSVIIMKTVIKNGRRVLYIATLEGKAVINPDTPNAIEIPAGFFTQHCLAEPANLGGADGQANDETLGEDCGWEPPQPFDPLDFAENQTVLTSFERLDVLSSSELPDSCPAGSNIVHVVASGETLFSIARRYNVGLGDVAAANNISDVQTIFAGQPLVIPCGVDSGRPAPAPNEPPPAPPAPVDCSTFAGTSPLGGLAYGLNTFYWNPAPGATGYRVTVVNLDTSAGGRSASFAAGAAATNLMASLTQETLGFGFSFAWRVEALQDDQAVCSSGPFTMGREAAPPDNPPPQAVQTPDPQPPPGPAFNASLNCVEPGFATANWSRLPAGTTSMTVVFSNPSGDIPTIDANPASDPGSGSFFPFETIDSATFTVQPSGASVTVPGPFDCSLYEGNF